LKLTEVVRHLLFFAAGGAEGGIMSSLGLLSPKSMSDDKLETRVVSSLAVALDGCVEGGGKEKDFVLFFVARRLTGGGDNELSRTSTTS
jgi:hypothetical protein